MSDKKVELTRRKVLGGLATIGAAGAATGAGTMAAFSDSEDSTGNTVSAGTLNLNIDGDEDATTTVNVGTDSPVAPGDSGSGSSTIKNTGSLDGVVDVAISNVSSGEGTNPEAETNTASPGDMLDHLSVSVYIDDDGDISTTGDQSEVVSNTANNIADDYEVGHTLASGSSSNLVVEWSLGDAGNEIQGDTVTFDISVMLDQNTGQ